MTNTEKLVEAVTYAKDSGTNWWEVFDSISDAMTIIKLAEKEEPEEGQVVCLLSVQDHDENLFESRTMYSAYRNTIRLMHRELKEISDE